METISIYGSHEVIADIQAEVSKLDNSKSQVIQKQNLDGNTATWIVIVTLATNLLPHILKFIRAKKVAKIKIDDIEVENPTEDMIETLNAAIKKRFDL